MMIRFSLSSFSVLFSGGLLASALSALEGDPEEHLGDAGSDDRVGHHLQRVQPGVEQAAKK